MIRLVLADMDETLKPSSSDAVSSRTVAAVEGLRAAGIEFGPASGRPRFDLVRFFHGDASCVSTGIISGGKRVYLDDRLVLDRPMSHETLVRLCAIVADEPETVMSLYDEEGHSASNPPEWLVVPTTDEELHDIQTGYTGLRADIAAMEVPERTFHVVGLMNGESPDRFAAMRTRVEAACPDIELVSPIPGWCDVNPRGWSKASGFEFLIGQIGISPEEVVFIGDSENDLTMMNLVPNSVCVANGTDSALAAARYHIPSAEEDGPAQLMEALSVTGGHLRDALARLGVSA